MYRLAPLLILLSICLIGCATVNQQHYEKPLYEAGVLATADGDTWQIDEISRHELANQKPGQRPSLETDEAGIWMVMDNAEKEIQTAGNRIQNPKLNKYIKDIACKLAPEYCEDINTHILRVPYFNASMAPNGTMVIWSGLLLRATSEAQVASVIGHEIGHYLRRHSLQRMRQIADTSSQLVVFQIITAVAGIGFVGDATALLAMGGLQAYSRDHEREADGYGLALMARAGYDPHEAGRLWHKVIKEMDASKDKKFSTLIFDSHPPEKERLKALDSLADRIVTRGNEFVQEAETYRTHLKQFRFEFLQDEIHQRDFERTEVLIDQLLVEGVDPGVLHHFKGELYRLRDSEGDREKAISSYETAVEQTECPPEAYRAIGMLFQKLGKIDKAKDAFNTYLEKKPDAVDRVMIVYMLSKEK